MSHSLQWKYETWINTFLLRSLFFSTVFCTADQFQCDDGECIPWYYECDDYVDCDGAEDEIHCGTVVVIKGEQLRLWSYIPVSSD